jgi:hypothetical protein
MSDYDRQRFLKVIEQGLERSEDDDVRIDSFTIVVIYRGPDEDGEEEEESTAVWSESKAHYAKVGMLHRGLNRLDYHEDD